ncbi:hypothetical protein [Pseudomonas rhizoryzae]|uniref:hypothetical protein n=1 Tax=Pseudomonas rhizoryzae TaxID=2571129 RepID=UPI000A5C4CB2|nr:hypothetical protein [Pseudomonas rhizoryzae]
MRASYLLPLIAVIGLSGCANWSTLYRKPNFSESDSLLTDIGARAIFVTPQDTKEGPNINLRNTPKTIVCAEPSPDSMQAYAAKLNWKLLSDSAVTRDAALAYSTAASYVGNRTQTVQLLRDQLYRLCEAYANGIIDSDTYTMLMSRSQRYTLALAMIDTSPPSVTPPPITPEKPDQDDPKPKAQEKKMPNERSVTTRPEPNLESIKMLVGAGDEAYVCLNFLKQADTAAKPTANQGKVEQFCRALFDEKIRTAKLANNAYESAIKQAEKTGTPVSPVESPLPPNVIDRIRIFHLEKPLPLPPQL